MCWQYKDPDAFPRGFMKEKLFKKIIDEGISNGLCAIKLQSRGEAMMHPKIFEYSLANKLFTFPTIKLHC